MDYRTVNTRANQLARRLSLHAAGRDQLVTIAMHRSPELVIAMLAIGGMARLLLPLDPDAGCTAGGVAGTAAHWPTGAAASWDRRWHLACADLDLRLVEGCQPNRRTSASDAIRR
jgi:non-ribosomal peptide synthetase component F